MDILTIFTMCSFILFFIVAAKNFITYYHRSIILSAICEYHVQCFRDNVESSVEYYDIEDYDTTFLRIWDWTNKRILPKDKFETIKPFLK